MAQGETPITLVGNAVADPELRFTPAGAAVAQLRVASTPRTYNRDTNQWEDGEALFLTCNIWKQAAENVAESISKGMRVIVVGRLKQRSYQTREGENRTVFEVEADEIAPSLKYATAQVTRTESKGNNGWNNTGGQQSQQPQPQQNNGIPGFGSGQPTGGFGGEQSTGGFGAGNDTTPW